jgi:serine/threonine protein kinase
MVKKVSLLIQKPKGNSRYEFIEDLGCGAYAKVMKARDTVTSKVVAIKTYRASSQLNVIWRDAPLREARYLRRLRHPNIVRLLGLSQTKSSVSLVLEYFGSGTLYTLLKGLII